MGFSDVLKKSFVQAATESMCDCRLYFLHLPGHDKKNVL